MTADRIEDCHNTLNGTVRLLSVHDHDLKQESDSSRLFRWLSRVFMTAEPSVTPRTPERTSSKVSTVHEFLAGLSRARF